MNTNSREAILTAARRSAQARGYSGARSAIIIVAGTIAVLSLLWPLFVSPPRGVDPAEADTEGVLR